MHIQQLDVLFISEMLFLSVGNGEIFTTSI